jgi:hypothetical protein
MLFFGSSRVVADGQNSLSTQNWWCASRRLATRQQLVDPYLLGIHTSSVPSLVGKPRDATAIWPHTQSAVVRTYAMPLASPGLLL